MAEVKTTDGRFLKVDNATARGLITMGFASPVKREVEVKKEEEKTQTEKVK